MVIIIWIYFVYINDKTPLSALQYKQANSIGIHEIFRTPILRLCPSFRGWIPGAKQVLRVWILAGKQNLNVA